MLHVFNAPTKEPLRFPTCNSSCVKVGLVQWNISKTRFVYFPSHTRCVTLRKLQSFPAAEVHQSLPAKICKTNYAKIETRSRLTAGGMVPELFHSVTRDNVSVPCTTTCDSQLTCHAECAFEYPLLDERKGIITKKTRPPVRGNSGSRIRSGK